jgi:hypothetical protein
VSIFSTYWLVKKIDMTQSAVAHLGRQSETTLRVAGLHFELCAFTPAASDAFEPPSCAANSRHRQRGGWQYTDTPARRRRSWLPETSSCRLAAPAPQRETDHAGAFRGELQSPRRRHGEVTNFRDHRA